MNHRKIEDLNLLGSSFEILSIENGGVIEEGFKKKMRELEEIFFKLSPQAEEFAPPPLSNNHGVVPISLNGEQFRFDSFNFVMQNGLADGYSLIKGRVQGVFYSDWAMDNAKELSLKGSELRIDAFKFVTQNKLADGNFNRKSEDEREMCARAISCTSIYKKFKHLRLPDDYHHSTYIGFVEFVMAIAVIKGRVQGVFYSDWGMENAKELSLKG
ncbi:hypothetical protein BC332_18800 [Capsicum chinense]|nr:hypothetical protein BC332_18800 [Capsicum chinense]